MKTNYDCLIERNEPLARRLIAADALVKTYPGLAAVAYGKAMEMFLAVICSDNDIAFDRTGDLTPINLIGTAYSYGVISRYEKGVLDDIRYTAYLVTQKDIAHDEIDTRTLLDKIISFFGMVMRYYHLENEEYSEDRLPIGGASIMAVTKTFELDTAYDKLFLTEEDDGSFSVVAQYITHRSDFADEVIALLRQGNLRGHFTACRPRAVLPPSIVPHQKGNSILCVKTHIPKGFVALSFDEAANLSTASRLRFVTRLASILTDLHTHRSPISLGGFDISDVWISYRLLQGVISGMESRISLSAPTASNLRRDIQSFAALAVCLLPEYEKIPVAGLLIKHALSGRGKAQMANIYAALKKEGRRASLEERTLSEASLRPPGELYAALSAETHTEAVSAAEPGASAPSSEALDFDEMYHKVFNRSL